MRGGEGMGGTDTEGGEREERKEVRARRNHYIIAPF